MAKKNENLFSSMENDSEQYEKPVLNLNKLEKYLGKEMYKDLMDTVLPNFNDEEDSDGDDDTPLENCVTTQEWSKTHPANLTCRSDAYYASLANDIRRYVDRFPLPPSTPEGFGREVGRVLAAYLEDNVSGTKVFSAMRRVCMKRYGYLLPFYDCTHDDYLTDHINEEDIRFLIWKTICRLGIEVGKTYSPLAPGWDFLSVKLFDLLDSRYEEAPEATRVADWLERSFRKGDYIDVRKAAEWLVLGNPLSYMPGYLEDIISGGEEAFAEDPLPAEAFEKLLYGAIAQESWQRSMSPMGCPSQMLTAAVAAEMGYDAVAADIEAIEVLPTQIYAMSRDKKGKVFFETYRTREKIEVQRESLSKGFRTDEMDYVECSLVRYKGKYMVNGVIVGGQELQLEWETQPAMLTAEQKRGQGREWIEAMDGRQVVCVTDIKKFSKQIGFPEDHWDDAPRVENYVVFLSEEMGLAVFPDVGYAFDIPGNRFYRKRRATKDSFGEEVFHNAIPYDVAMYIQENHLLPEACIDASQGKEVGRSIVQDYMAFWIGFYCALPSYGVAPELFPDD